MQGMQEKDIRHLAELSRLDLTPEEVTKLQGEIDAIVEYVSVIQSMVTDDVSTKSLGPVHNVFRPDEVTIEPSEYTERLLQAAPHTHDGYVQVKKILNQDQS